MIEDRFSSSTNAGVLSVASPVDGFNPASPLRELPDKVIPDGSAIDDMFAFCSATVSALSYETLTTFLTRCEASSAFDIDLISLGEKTADRVTESRSGS